MKLTKTLEQYTPLFPLIAIGLLVLLCIAILASYSHTNSVQGTIILPGGVTYLGK